MKQVTALVEVSDSSKIDCVANALRTITDIYMLFTLFILHIFSMILTAAMRIFIYSRKNMTGRSRCPCSAAARLPYLNPAEITCVCLPYLLSVLQAAPPVTILIKNLN